MLLIPNINLSLHLASLSHLSTLLVHEIFRVLSILPFHFPSRKSDRVLLFLLLFSYARFVFTRFCFRRSQPSKRSQNVNTIFSDFFKHFFCKIWQSQNGQWLITLSSFLDGLSHWQSMRQDARRGPERAKIVSESRSTLKYL